MDKLKVVLVGAGDRGETYVRAMAKFPERFDVIAVAEPVESKRNSIRNMFNIPEEMCFNDWTELFKLGKIADVVIIATLDRDHFEPTMKAISLKYDILLEKPISPFPDECIKLSKAAQENGVKVLVCHVLRYTPFFKKLKEIIDSGEIGYVMSIDHEECVGNIHQTHSFVRGNWGNSERSSCMLLQKSCHDMDILQWLLGKKCRKVQSFGTLSFFCEDNAPEGAPEYCLEGCPAEKDCPYHAAKLYMDESQSEEHKKWFRNACTKQANPTLEMVEHSLRTTQYGKCVFKCDNDVVDHQTVNLLFEDDVTVTFSMNAFSKPGRHIHVMGTKGEIRAAVDGTSPINVYNLFTEKTTTYECIAKDGILGGHGGGDVGIVNELYDYLQGDYKGKSVATIDESCNNHMIVFAAEESRQNGTVVDFDEFIGKYDPIK